MPRVYSIEMLGDIPEERYEDEDFDPFLASPEAFQYLPPPEFGGPQGEVRVAVRPEQVGTIKNGPSFLDQFKRNDPSLAESERSAATVARALAKLGAVKAYIRYDGGNDEGFAWFSHCEMRDGTTLDADAVGRMIDASSITPPSGFYPRMSMGQLLEEVVAQSWAATLLGEGFGTGEYVMYGGFSVDLATGVVTDDMNPAPIVRNIQFEGR